MKDYLHVPAILSPEKETASARSTERWVSHRDGLEQTTLYLPGIKPRMLGRQILNLITVPSELPQMTEK